MRKITRQSGEIFADDFQSNQISPYLSGEYFEKEIYKILITQTLFQRPALIKHLFYERKSSCEEVHQTPDSAIESISVFLRSHRFAGH